jgi:hypothetical protein
VNTELQDLVDHHQIAQLQDTYADLVNRGAWNEYRDIIHDDAPILFDIRTRDPLEVRGPDAAAKFLAKAIERFSFFQFAILSRRIYVHLDDNPDIAGARMYICEHRRDTETGEWSDIYGVYHDRCARVEDRWWIVSRRFHFLTLDTDPPVFAFPGGELF